MLTQGTSESPMLRQEIKMLNLGTMLDQDKRIQQRISLKKQVQDIKI